MADAYPAGEPQPHRSFPSLPPLLVRPLHRQYSVVRVSVTRSIGASLVMKFTANVYPNVSRDDHLVENSTLFNAAICYHLVSGGGFEP